MPTDVWVVEESGFDRERANFYETLFTVGNGRLGTRGSLEEGHLGQLSGTFLAGVYDGHDVPVIDLVNCPDWVDTTVFVGGVRLDVDTCTVVTHHRVLGPAGRASDPDHRVRGRRGPADTAGDDALREHGRPQGLRAAGRGHPREPCGGDPGRDRHRRGPPQPRTASALPGGHGVPSGDPVGEMGPRPPSGGVVPVRRGRGPLPGDAHDRHRYRPRIRRRDDLRAATAAAHGAAAQWADHRGDRARRCPGETLRMDKLVAICTSRDPDGPATGTLRDRCRAVLAEHREGGFDAVVAASRAVWGRLWDECDCEVVGNAPYTRALRFCLYHLMIAANPEDPTVNIGANALAGERYRGHVFWDTEIFLLPFYILTQPDTAKALLRYRHHTLDGARANSREYGTGGARYAWESADTGREECPKFTADGANRFWTREEEIHVSADVAYGIVRYVEATGDTAFLHDVGAEILFETSRFWVDRVVSAADGAGYELRQVMGPDEFHSHIDNNAFTNRLAQWHLTQAVTLYDELRDAPSGGDRRARIEHRPRSDRTRSLAGGRRRARRRPVQGRSHRAVHRLLRARRRAHRRVGRQQHAALPEGLPPLQLREHPTAQAARRRHADVPAARRVQRRGQEGELRVLRGPDAAQVVAEPVDPRDHRHRGRRHDPGGPVLRALGLRRPHRQPGQHRRGHAHRLRGRHLADPRQRVRRACASSAAASRSPRGCPTTGRASGSASAGAAAPSGSRSTTNASSCCWADPRAGPRRSW